MTPVPVDAKFNIEERKPRRLGPVEFAIDGRDDTAWACAINRASAG